MSDATVLDANEIVVLMSQADLDAIRALLIDAHERASSNIRKQQIADLANRFAHNADTLTLNWLDQRLTEFP